MSIVTPHTHGCQHASSENLDVDNTIGNTIDTSKKPVRKRKPKPTQRKPYLNFIPSGLRDHHNWVSWRMANLPDQQTGDFRWTKIPVCAAPGDLAGKNAKSNDSTTWTTFANAWDFFWKNKTDGVGFMLADGLAAIDLDKCRDPQTGVIDAWARAIIDRSNSYWEISPSGKGIHIFGYGAVDPDGPKRRGKIETYSKVRFVTITGWMESRHPRDRKPLADIQSTIDWLQSELAEFGDTACGQAGERVPVKKHATLAEDVDIANLAGAERMSLFGTRRWHNGSEGAIDSDRPIRSHPSSFSSSSASDTFAFHASRFVPTEADILERAASASNGAAFTELWNGGGSADHSAADLALCNLLAFYCGPNHDLVDSLFRQSGLMRDKWDTQRGGTTYGRQTIAKALAGRTVFFEWDAAARRQAEREQQAADREAKRLADVIRDYAVRAEASQRKEQRFNAAEAANNAEFAATTSLDSLMQSRGLPISCQGLPRADGCGFSRHLRGRGDHTRRIAGRLCCRGWSKCQYCRARNSQQRASYYAGVFDKHDRAEIPLAMWCGPASQLESVKKRIKRADKEYVAILQPGSKFTIITNADAACLEGIANTELRTLPRGGAIVAFVDALADIPEHLDRRSRPIRASRFWQYAADREPSQYEVDPKSDQIAVSCTHEQFKELLRSASVKSETKSEVSNGFDQATYYHLPEYAWDNLCEWILIFGPDSPCPPDILWRKPDAPCPFSSLFKRGRGGISKDENGHDGINTPPPRRHRWVDPSPN